MLNSVPSSIMERGNGNTRIQEQDGKINQQREKENPKIMIVEDDSDMASLYRSFLSRNGYRIVIQAATVGEAKQKFKEAISYGTGNEKPQVAILDRRLPDGDGLELGKTLI